MCAGDTEYRNAFDHHLSIESCAPNSSKTAARDSASMCKQTLNNGHHSVWADTMSIDFILENDPNHSLDLLIYAVRKKKSFKFMNFSIIFM